MCFRLLWVSEGHQQGAECGGHPPGCLQNLPNTRLLSRGAYTLLYRILFGILFAMHVLKDRGRELALSQSVGCPLQSIATRCPRSVRLLSTGRGLRAGHVVPCCSAPAEHGRQRCLHLSSQPPQPQLLPGLLPSGQQPHEALLLLLHLPAAGNAASTARTLFTAGVLSRVLPHRVVSLTQCV